MILKTACDAKSMHSSQLNNETATKKFPKNAYLAHVLFLRV